MVSQSLRFFDNTGWIKYLEKGLPRFKKPADLSRAGLQLPRSAISPETGAPVGPTSSKARLQSHPRSYPL